MSTKIFLDAGHFLRDSGVIFGPLRENVLAGEAPNLGMMVRDQLKPLLLQYIVEYVPDELSLAESIAWINVRAKPQDFGISVHFNGNNNTAVRGTEAYYFNNPRYAEIFSRKMSEALSIPNRGPKPDTATWVGSLGFLRKLVCPSVVVEVAYLSNEQDRAVISRPDAGRNIARGLAAAVETLFLLPAKEDEIQQKITLLKQLIALYQRLIEFLKGRR